MMRQKHIITILLSLLLMAFSLFSFSQSDTLCLKKIKSKRLVKQLVSGYNSYYNCSYKIDANVETKDKKHRLNISYRNVRDSIIWINVSHNSGIPVARFLITPDSTKFLNRLKNTYMLMTNSDIQKKFGYDVNFDMIQAIFNSELIKLEEDKEPVKAYGRYKVYQDSGLYVLQNLKERKIQRLIKKDKIAQHLLHKVFIDRDFRIKKNQVEDHTKHQTIWIDYDKYKENKGFLYAKIINFLLKNQEESLSVKLKVRKAKYNLKKLSFSFKIPSKYTEKQIQGKSSSE